MTGVACFGCSQRESFQLFLLRYDEKFGFGPMIHSLVCKVIPVPKKAIRRLLESEFAGDGLVHQDSDWILQVDPSQVRKACLVTCHSHDL